GAGRRAGLGGLLAAAACLCAAGPAAGGEAGRGPTRLVLSYSALVASQSPSWIARETGIFRKHGLEVELVYISSSSQSTAALLAGEVDAAIIGGIGIMNAVLQGGDVRLIGATKNRLTGRIMARPEIRRVEDLRGKRIAVSRRGSNTEYMAIQVLKRFGLDPAREVSFVYAGGEPESVAALASGSAQAVASVPPNDKRAEALGARELVNVTAIGVKYPATTLATSGKTIREKPEALARLVAALREAVRVYKTEPETAVRVIAQYTKTDDLAAVREAYEVEREAMTDDLRVDPEAVAAALEELAAQRPEARQKRYEDFVDARFVR
ncbi:MAG TPA: ABC transporter substrate-binding protein, partial [Thermodesulfobacteriota bacterium]|nr:ABC transporter substrate-binding protein [Thermodesulfobacteriota bacterium]